MRGTTQRATAAPSTAATRLPVLSSRGHSRARNAPLSRNALVGEMGILSDAPRSATIVASEPTTALRIDKRVFLELLIQFPQMSIAVMRELASRLERTNAQLAALARSDRA